MRDDHVNDQSFASTVADLEEDDAPEDVQKYEAEREKRGGDEKVVRVAGDTDRTRTDRIVALC